MDDQLSGQGRQGGDQHQFDLNGMIPQVGGHGLEKLQGDQDEQQLIEEFDQGAPQPVLAWVAQIDRCYPGQLQGGHHHHQHEHQRQPFRQLALEQVDQLLKPFVAEGAMEDHGGDQ
jgi:hypothetical protein